MYFFTKNKKTADSWDKKNLVRKYSKKNKKVKGRNFYYEYYWCEEYYFLSMELEIKSERTSIQSIKKPEAYCTFNFCCQESELVVHFVYGPGYRIRNTK